MFCQGGDYIHELGDDEDDDDDDEGGKMDDDRPALPIYTHFVCLKGLGFGVSGSGFRALGFGFWVSGSGFRLLGFGFRVWAGLVVFRVPGLVAALLGEVLCLKLGVFQTCGLCSTGHL